MNNKIFKDKLDTLTGLPLSDISRTLDRLEIGFGDIFEIIDSCENIRINNQYEFYLQAPWRLLLDHRILVASYDIYEPNSKMEWTEDFRDDIIGNTLFDELCETKVQKLLDEISVKEISLDEYGGLKIIFDSGHVLETFANSADSEWELWRFFESGKKEPHYVVYVDRVDFE
jgi:hypothetical protein